MDNDSIRTFCILTISLCLVGIFAEVGEIMYQSKKPIAASKMSEVEVEKTLDVFVDASLKSSCQGAFAYYSGTNFSKDVVGLKAAYLVSYDNTTGQDISESMYLPPPSAILYGKKVSCTALAHWVGCLASYYPNVRCVPKINDEQDHIYLVCFEFFGDGSVNQITT